MHRALLLLILLGSTLLHAQAPQAPPAAPPADSLPAVHPIFRAELPGGTYAVAVRAMVAVSSHEYLVDGVARVTEVNIDTTGALLARFYFLEPNTLKPPAGAATLDRAQQLLAEAADRTGQDVWKKVIKSYPTTTHARTVEYRVASKEQLTKLFASADEAFRLNKAVTVKIE